MSHDLDDADIIWATVTYVDWSAEPVEPEDEPTPLGWCAVGAVMALSALVSLGIGWAILRVIGAVL